MKSIIPVKVLLFQKKYYDFSIKEGLLSRHKVYLLYGASTTLLDPAAAATSQETSWHPFLSLSSVDP